MDDASYHLATRPTSGKADNGPPDPKPVITQARMLELQRILERAVRRRRRAALEARRKAERATLS